MHVYGMLKRGSHVLALSVIGTTIHKVGTHAVKGTPWTVLVGTACFGASLSTSNSPVMQGVLAASRADYPKPRNGQTTYRGITWAGHSLSEPRVSCSRHT